ncbi:hypothetical protein BC829DRAFT_439537 [Chytridium lagenaria]|nr:hypothetical protein BC829DRAFT_439537 [Chytridium lagenaria]
MANAAVTTPTMMLKPVWFAKKSIFLPVFKFIIGTCLLAFESAKAASEALDSMRRSTAIDADWAHPSELSPMITSTPRPEIQKILQSCYRSVKGVMVLPDKVGRLMERCRGGSGEEGGMNNNTLPMSLSGKEDAINALSHFQFTSTASEMSSQPSLMPPHPIPIPTSTHTPHHPQRHPPPATSTTPLDRTRNRSQSSASSSSTTSASSSSSVPTISSSPLATSPPSPLDWKEESELHIVTVSRLPAGKDRADLLDYVRTAYSGFIEIVFVEDDQINALQGAERRLHGENLVPTCSYHLTVAEHYETAQEGIAPAEGPAQAGVVEEKEAVGWH